jgi:hypothetical protein
MVALFLLGLGVFLLPFAFPTPPPIVTRFSSTVGFSPNGDGRRDLALIAVRLRQPSQVTLEVRDGDQNVVRSLARDVSRPRGRMRVRWYGRDDRGRVVPDGEYALALRVTSGRKNYRSSRRVVVDTHAPQARSMTVVSAALDGDGPGQCRLSLSTDEAGSALLEAAPARTPRRAVRRLGPRPVSADGTLRWAWDGRNSTGRPVRPGLYVLRARLADRPANRAALERTCWVGHVRGSTRPARPRPGDRVTVDLRAPDGSPLPPETPVALSVHRRAGTPGRTAGPVLGPRVGPGARGPAGDVAVTLPRRLGVEAVWLVAVTPEGRALIELGGG